MPMKLLKGNIDNLCNPSWCDPDSEKNEINQKLLRESRGAVFSKRVPLAAGGKINSKENV